MSICLSGAEPTYLTAMSRLRGKCARWIALLALLAGLIGAAVPGLAASAVAQPMLLHGATGGATDCGHGDHQRRSPQQHLPAGDCCMVNACAMSLALPVAPSGLVAPAFAQNQDYALGTPPQPVGIVTAPLPHPPKSAA
jgi:hypothetical protein